MAKEWISQQSVTWPGPSGCSGNFLIVFINLHKRNNPQSQVPRDLTEPTLSGAIVSCCTVWQPCYRGSGSELAQYEWLRRCQAFGQLKLLKSVMSYKMLWVFWFFLPVLRTSNDSFVWLRLIEILQVSVALYLFAAEFLVKTLVVFASTSAAVGKLANTTSLGCVLLPRCFFHATGRARW